VDGRRGGDEEALKSLRNSKELLNIVKEDCDIAENGKIKRLPRALPHPHFLPGIPSSPSPLKI
jgi:hypothetical protein